MKKLIIIFSIIVLIVVFFPKEEKEIRVRVVPNSNEENDLVIKNNVQKRTEELLKELLANKKDYDEIKDIINANINYINEELNKIDEIKTSFSNHNMGIKSYNDKVITGNELTLLIKIKEAKGDNWWGTLYPDLLGISTSEKTEYKFWMGG